MPLGTSSEVADFYEQAARLGSIRRERGCACLSVVERYAGVAEPGTEGLEVGEVRCVSGCGQVFESWGAWLGYQRALAEEAVAA